MSQKTAQCVCMCVCVCVSVTSGRQQCVTQWHVAGRPQTSRRQRVLAEGGGAPGVPRPCACGQGAAGRQRQLPAATHRVSRVLASASFGPFSGLGLLCAVLWPRPSVCRALASASCAVLWPRPPVCRALASAFCVPCSGLGLLCRALASASCAVLKALRVSVLIPGRLASATVNVY